jgi:hypothetical protein
MAASSAADADGGYLVVGTAGRFRVASLDDLTIYDAAGDVVDLQAAAKWSSPMDLIESSSVVIDVVTDPDSLTDDPTEAAPGPRHRREQIRVNGKQAEFVSHLLPLLVERIGDDPTASAASLAERMIASIPRETLGQRWQELIGPFYSANDIAAWRGVSRQNIHKLRSAGKLLAARPSNEKTLLFPAWQFGPEGQELPHLRDVVEQLGEAAPDEWAQALWLIQKTDRFGGRSAADLLKAGEIEHVLAAARSDAAGMAA